jgi:hypothetical protein
VEEPGQERGNLALVVPDVLVSTRRVDKIEETPRDRAHALPNFAALCCAPVSNLVKVKL